MTSTDRHHSSEEGFSLLEVLVSLVLLVMTSAGILPAFLSHFNHITNNEVRSSAYAAAQRVLDEIRVQDPTDLPSSGDGTTQNITISGKNFQVTPSYCQDSGMCGDVNSRHITVRVRYNGTIYYVVETLYTQLR